VRRDWGTSTHQIPWTRDSGDLACACPCSSSPASRGTSPLLLFVQLLDWGGLGAWELGQSIGGIQVAAAGFGRAKLRGRGRVLAGHVAYRGDEFWLAGSLKISSHEFSHGAQVWVHENFTLCLAARTHRLSSLHFPLKRKQK
jgi:hypothetical protein